MSVYVVSDLHGEYQTLLKLLEKILFSPSDTLYIIGDVVDRGKEGVKILEYAMNTPNIVMMLGNHEHMCMDFFSELPDQKVVRRWNRNSNFYTLAGFDEVGEERKRKLLDYIRSLPSELHITVDGKKFALIHGFTGKTDFDRVWNRPEIGEKPDLPDDETLIIGHTPVGEYVCPGDSLEDLYVYSRKLTEAGDHFRILHAKHFIDIDCNVGYGLSAARMACLRLNDGMEFYQEVVPEC